MDINQMFQNVFLSLFEWVGIEQLKFVPWVFALIVLILVAYLHRNVRAPMLLATLTYFASNVMLFFYILLQPLRAGENRWTEGVQRIDMPELSSVSHMDSGNALTDIVADKVNPVIDWANAFGAGANEAGAGIETFENLRRGMVHTYEFAEYYLIRALIGFAVLLVVLIIYMLLRRSAKKKARKRELEEHNNLVKEFAAQTKRIVAQDNHIKFLCDVLRDMGAENTAYRVQVKNYGHSFEPGKSLPFKPDYDYLGNPSAYADHVEQYFKRKRAREQGHAESQQMSASTLLDNRKPTT